MQGGLVLLPPRPRLGAVRTNGRYGLDIPPAHPCRRLDEYLSRAAGRRRPGCFREPGFPAEGWRGDEYIARYV